MSDAIVRPMAWFCFAVIGIAMFTAYGVFFLSIYPTLERLGFKRDHLGWRKWEHGFFTTLNEYKKSRIAEDKPLIWWRVYWWSMWVGAAAFCGFVLLGICLEVNASRRPRQQNSPNFPVRTE